MSKRVRTLLRVSSRQQLHDDDIPMQRAEAERYIAMRSDWEFDREYIEKAVSAYKNSAAEREVLQEILSDAKKQQFDVLLTYMSDRIGRQEEYSFYVAALNQLGIEVWTIKDGQLKTEEHIDKLLNYIRFWQNEGESKKTGMRVRDTQREMIKAGKFTGGRAPYGYRLVLSGMVSNHGRLLQKLEIVEEKAETVRKIYDFFLYQGMGYDKIARTLNGQGIPAIMSDKWKAGTIRNILMNPVYMGYPAINRRINQGSHARMDRNDWVYSDRQISELIIVPKQAWEEAQRIREARRTRIRVSKEKAAEEYETQYPVPFSTKGRLALTGLVYCGYCGKRLKNGCYINRWTTKTGEKQAYVGRYLCPEKCALRSCYAQNYLEDVVFTTVENYLERMIPIDITEELREKQNRLRESAWKDLKAIQKKQQTLRLDMQTLEQQIPAAVRGEYCFSAEKLSRMIQEKEQLFENLEKKAELIKERLRQIENKNDSLIGSKINRPTDNALNQNGNIANHTSAIPNWKELFHNADTAAKKMLLSALIEKIEVKKDSVTIKFRIR